MWRRKKRAKRLPRRPGRNDGREWNPSEVTMRKESVFAACLLACMGGAALASGASPTFFARRDYPGLGYNQVAVADTNGDRIPDAIELGGGGAVQVLFGNGNGTFRQGPTTSLALGFATADLNGDGKVDLVLAGSLQNGRSEERRVGKESRSRWPPY